MAVPTVPDEFNGVQREEIKAQLLALVDRKDLPEGEHGKLIQAAYERLREFDRAKANRNLQPPDITVPPIEAYGDDFGQRASGPAPKPTLLEATTSLEVMRRLDAWQPREPEALLTLPAMPVPIVDKLVQPGTVAVAPGEGGSGKTTLFMNMNMSIATGTDFLCFACTNPGSSVHLLAEDDQQRAEYTLTRSLMDERQQLKAEGWSPRAIEEYTEDVRKRVRLVSVRGTGATLAVAEFGAYRVSATVDAICRSLEKIPDLRVVVFDTLSRFAGVQLDSNDSAPIVLTALERIAERTGAFVVALHHTGKEAARTKNEDQYSARGASAITDNARLVMRLRPLDAEEISQAGLVPGRDGERTYLRLSVPKSNYFTRPDPVTICRSGFLFRVAKSGGHDVGALYRDQLSSLSAAIDELHRQQLKASNNALEKMPIFGGRNQAREIIKTLISQGWIERRGTGPTTEVAVTTRGHEVLKPTGEFAARSGEDES